jgi:hypothetical protein
MNHPDKTRLALLAGDDLGFLEATFIRVHLRTCEYCQARMQAFHHTRQVIADAAQDLPPGLDWNRLAEEMTGNIRVGLAAGECVGAYPIRTRLLHLRWNGAIAAMALAGIFATGLWLKMGREAPAPRASLSYVASDPGNVVVSVSARGSSSTRAIDDDTGQTTITEVYDAR